MKARKAMKAKSIAVVAMKAKSIAVVAVKARKAMKAKSVAVVPAAMKARKAMKAKSVTVVAMKARKAMKAKSVATVAMKARKAMKAAKEGAKMTASGAYTSVSESTGLKSKDVKAAVEGLMAVAATQLQKVGSFKIAGMLNMKLKKKPARPARKGVNPFTKEPCVFKAKPASKTVRALPMKKLKEMIN